MSTTKNVLTAFLVFTFFSCSNKSNDQMANVNDYLKSVIPENELAVVKNVIIIPREGCGGCIKNATSVAMASYSNETAYIFTMVQDKKIFRQQVGRDFLSKKHVYIDSLNHYQRGELYDPYPKICEIIKGKAISFTNYDPPPVAAK